MAYNKSVSTRKELSIPEKFRQRGRAKRAKGEEYQHWYRAAAIIQRIEAGLPVGHYRRRRRSAGKGVAV